MTQEDLSRFGRDYLTVGQYTDIIFPSYDVRFIAVNDGVDSERGDSDGFAAIRNLFNEWYPRDTSKKVRVVFRQKGTSGKHLGKPPYGYRTDPTDKDHWIIDENMCIFPDTQEAIVSQAQWDRVQELRKNKRRPTKAERQGLFSGLLFCPDCGNKLHFATCKSFDGKNGWKHRKP